MLDDLIFVSVDDHVVEPPHLFEGRMPAAYADRAPKVIRTDAGDDVWSFEGAMIPNIGLNAVAGRPKEEYGVDPTSYDEMRPGCWDIHERVKDMSAGGILAAMCFPSFPSFSGRLFLTTEDKGLATAVVRAYNDWHIDEWCGTYPERHIPMAIPMLWDPEASAEEIRRVSAKGCHSLTFTENPATLGLPSFHSEHWDPDVAGPRGDRDDHERPPRLVRSAGGDRPGRPDGRDDHAPADEHLRRRRRPRLVPCLQGVSET